MNINYKYILFSLFFILLSACGTNIQEQQININVPTRYKSEPQITYIKGDVIVGKTKKEDLIKLLGEPERYCPEFFALLGAAQ